MRKFGADVIVGIWTAFCIACNPAWADDHCVLQQIAKLDMSILRDGRVSVPMTVQGQQLNMLVDTGGLLSMLTPKTIGTLGLMRQSIPMSRISQYGGLRIDHFAEAHDISLGGLTARKFVFLEMPEGGHPQDIDGLLAPDIMRNYDVEFDFAGAALKLMSPDHCEGNVVYWTHDPFGSVEFTLNEAGQISVPIMLDGHEIHATIDTGAYRSVVSLETIEDLFNIDEKNADLHLAPRATADRPVYRYPFKTLSVQSITVTNPDITLMPNSMSRLPPGAPKMLLGINVLRQLHLYFAYHEHTLYVTPATAH